jgi:hypothetical protein
MENKKNIDTLFGLVVISFLAVAILALNQFDTKRIKDQKESMATMSQLIKFKNDRIIILSKRLVQKQRQYDALQRMLVDTRNNLDVLSKRLPEATLPSAAATR